MANDAPFWAGRPATLVSGIASLPQPWFPASHRYLMGFPQPKDFMLLMPREFSANIVILIRIPLKFAPNRPAHTENNLTTRKPYWFSESGSSAARLWSRGSIWQ
jgi:hypothetical protein